MSHLFKPKRVFISAHPGDVALSAFGSLINGPLGSKDAVLVTVFDRSEDENLSLQPLEDRIFSVAYGCDFLALGFMDSKVRSSPEDIQEANLPKEDPIFESVRDAIRTAIASYLGSSPIYIPLGISGNIDHCIVRDAVVDIVSKRPSRTEENLLFFYEEIPSTLYHKEYAIMEYARLLLGANAARHLVDIHRWDDKRDAINIYASRSGEEIISSLMHYAKSLGAAGGMAEGVWFMNKIPEPSHLVDILAWVSWEAARFLGGYTTLLSNLTGSPVYQTHVKKTILIGPLYMPVDCDAYDPLETPQSIAKRLNCIILYSPYQKPEDTMVHISLSNAFREIERRHDIEIYYLRDKETDSHVVERLLINFSACITPSRTYSRTLPAFLESLREKMGLNFIYEPIWRHSTIWNAIYGTKFWTGINPSDNIIENFRRKVLCDAGLQSYNHTDNNSLYGALLAEPATETLQAILGQNQTCVFIAQDTLSLPMAYNIGMVRNRERKLKMQTIYYTGDVDPIRNLIDGYVLPVTQENSVGGFDWEGPIRRVITKSIKISHSLEKRNLLDIPALSHIETHGNLRLIRQGWKLDKVAAISDNVVDELRFVDPGFSNLDNIPICYPGILMLPCTINSKERARRLVLSYASAEWGYCLDPETTLIAVHIARAVRAKAFPRDISLIKALGQCLRAEGMGILLIIVTAWKGRGGQLVSDLLSASEEMNTPGSNVRLKVVNEFHWPDQTESGSSPTCFSRQDLHMATDISLGLSTYDTFAISPLEPVSCGAICMISTGCGCARRLQKLKGIESNILVADYGKRLEEILDVKDNFESIFEITNLQKESLEEQATKEFAVELAEKVPRNTAQRTDSLARGIMIGKQMNWENEIAHSFIPILKELVCPNQ